MKPSAVLDQEIRTEAASPRNASPLLAEALWVAVGQAGAVLGALVALRLLTTALAPEDFGRLALALTVASFAQQVVFGPLSSAALRFLAPAIEHGDAPALLAVLRRGVALSAAALAAAGLAAGAVMWAAGWNSWRWLLIGAFALSVLSGITSILEGLQNAARRRAVVAVHQTLGQWLRAVSAAVLVYLAAGTGEYAMLGYCLAAAAVLASQYTVFRMRMAIPRTSPATLPLPSTLDPVRSRVWAYCWPFMLWGIFTWTQGASERWALQAFRPTSEVGLYQTLYQLGFYPTSLIAGVAVQVAMPILFAGAGRGNDPERLAASRETNRRMVSVSLVVSVAATVAAALLHDRIFDWFTAPRFRHVSHWLPGMVLSGGLFATGQIAVLQQLSAMQAKALIGPKVGTAVLGALGSGLGAWLWGFPGVVTSSIVTSAAYLCWVLRLGSATGVVCPPQRHCRTAI